MENLLGIKTESGAEFSECRKFRYALWRIWDWQGHGNCMMVVGLNPSTADETENDNTIRRCIAFAKRERYGGLFMLNLFAFRATKPENMVAADDPMGPKNLEAFGYYRSRVGKIVVAWGSLKVQYRPRVKWKSTIAAVVDAVAQPVYCFGTNQDGEPKHPLYLGQNTPLEIWKQR